MHIRNILEKKRLVSTGTKINLNYEEAKEFSEYVGGGINTLIALRLFKTYGKQKVLGIKSFLKDYPYDPQKGLIGIAIWKLKQS